MTWVALAAVVAVLVAAVSLGLYGGSLGLPGLHSSPAPQSAPLSVDNATLTSTPSIEDGQVGLGAKVFVVNHDSEIAKNVTVTVNSLSLGNCNGADEIQPGQTLVCRVGKSISCDAVPYAPYEVKVAATFDVGGASSASTSISSQLTYQGC